MVRRAPLNPCSSNTSAAARTMICLVLAARSGWDMVNLAIPSTTKRASSIFAAQATLHQGIEPVRIRALPREGDSLMRAIATESTLNELTPSPGNQSSREFAARQRAGGWCRPDTDAPPPTTSALTSTVPRQYVHRAALAEVFLTKISNVGPASYRVSAQWPRWHALYGPRGGLIDPMLASETVRQTIPLLSHTAFDVPLGHVQSWEHIYLRINRKALRAEMTPPEIELRIRSRDTVLRGKRLGATTLDVLILRDNTLLGSAEARFACHTPLIYKRLRGAFAGVDPLALVASLPQLPPVEPHLVGRDRAEDVVLSPADEPHRWQLRVDPTHPILFDHPVDHAPGMLLLEAARQAAQAVCAPESTVLLSLDSAFTRYVELDSPCWIEAEPLSTNAQGSSLTLITGRQNGDVAFRARVTTAPLADA
ncbi:ScbA/BarX family gamma-butyrolactone biosynthesis protein [Streptomyces sp. NPDC101733]|uniref:ScbA/BarX family gamma-butyrolactone biosynthesis protein n=1 Tax=unclassified Streptomyces TaxID=2593676 RepID=UPI00381D91CA